MKLSVRETETIIKILTPAYCPITKASNNSHFHSSQFLVFIFPANISDFFLSLLPFLILEIKNNRVLSHDTTRTAPRVVRSTKLSDVLRDGWPKTNTPCGNNFFFCHSLSKAILKTAELPSLVWRRLFFLSSIRRNDITQGWGVLQSLTSPSKGNEKKRSYYHTGYSFLVAHPGTNPDAPLSEITLMRCEETDANILEPVKLLQWTKLKETFTVATNWGYITGNKFFSENLIKNEIAQNW